MPIVIYMQVCKARYIVPLCIATCEFHCTRKASQILQRRPMLSADGLEYIAVKSGKCELVAGIFGQATNESPPHLKMFIV